MRIDIMTLFPEMVSSALGTSIIGRGCHNGFLEIKCHQIRDYTLDRHNNTDDAPYGGGMGMVMQADPIYRCWENIVSSCSSRPYTVYLSPKGTVLTQHKAIELSHLDSLILICGHYEGVDQRLIDEIVDEEISIGDYVLTGGEAAAIVLADCIGRLCPGVLSSEESFEDESHYNGLLEYPQYTRPPEWHGMKVPDILFSGHHAKIARWRRERSLELTLKLRPDMLLTAPLTDEDKEFLRTLAPPEEL